MLFLMIFLLKKEKLKEKGINVNIETDKYVKVKS